MEDSAKLDLEFPSIQQAWKESMRPNLRETLLGELIAGFLADGVDFGLRHIDESLEVLLRRFSVSSLRDPLMSLFGPANKGQRERTFRKAGTELFALAEMERHGLLRDLGWPSGVGDNPPFDFRLEVGPAVVPVDVKDANGDGLRVAHRLIESFVKPWAGANDVPAYRIVLRYRGLVSQRSIGDDIFKRGTLQGFKNWLAQQRTIPSESFGVEVGDTSISIRIVPEAVYLHESGGIQGTNPLIRALAETFGEHVTHKSQAAEEQEQTPFLLAYVRLPGYGASDIKTLATFRDAQCIVAGRVSQLKYNARSLWLGSLFFHPSGDRMIADCCLRPEAAWPEGLSAEELTTRLGGKLSIL